MHYLCHILNLNGYEAYVSSSVTAPYLWTPSLDEGVVRKHFESALKPIVIYPEITRGTPLGFGIPIRWLLAPAGKISGHTDFSNGEITIGYREAFTEHPDTPLLTVPTADPHLFSPGLPSADRSGKYFFYNRLLDTGGKLLPITADAIEISPRQPRSLKQLSEIFKTAEVLYCYEEGSITLEARMCGCPVVFLPNERWLPRLPESNFSKDGIAWGCSEEEIAYAKATVHNIHRQALALYDNFQSQLEAFIDLTQKVASATSMEACYGSNHDFPSLPHNALNASIAQHQAISTQTPEKAYLRWLDRRAMLVAQSAPAVLNREGDQAAFQIIVRVAADDGAGLASTLDALGEQIHAGWHLDILTPLPAPEGLADIPCIGWHTVAETADLAALTRQLVESSEYDWVIELPVGSRPDPLYLWRIARTAASNTEHAAFFVDDDCYDESGSRANPRLKPGVNRAALLESDLAGPLCVRRALWLAAEVRHDSPCPWFDKLLAIAAIDAWDSLGHIADILISHPHNAPEHGQACRSAVLAHLRGQGIAAEVLDSGTQGWHIRYPLSAAPSVTIIVISASDVLHSSIARCLETIQRYTRYPAFDIIVCKPDGNTDSDLLAEIERRQATPGVRIELLSPPAAQSHATLCNLAAQAANGEFLAFLDEEVQIVQDSWLEELIRNALQSGIGAVVPCQIQPGTSLINSAGPVLGLNGLLDAPYRGRVKYGTSVPLNWLRTTRDLGTLPKGGFLVRKSSYLQAGGIDDGAIVADLSAADLGLRLRAQGERLIYQPLSNIVYQPPATGPLPEPPEALARKQLAQYAARDAFIDRWYPEAASDPFWNPNLSLTGRMPELETELLPPWYVAPSLKLRVLARPVTNGQGYFRVTAPLDALHAKGQIQRCIWDQGAYRPAHPAELLRLAPDVLVVQNYLGNSCLQELQDIRRIPTRPFVIQTLDDLLTGLAESNPLRATVPPNPAERIRHSLALCDRLIVSTDYLAEYHSHHIKDIKVVPNRLEQALWLPLSSAKRTGRKPRIGWAGGTTHQNDLLLLEEIIKATSADADWVFMGMCPESIRPLLAEYHPLVGFADYPAYLASLNFDIAVAPLAETPFNCAKSNLRLLEYGILGIPVVCTDIDPYRNSPACRVRNRPTEWIDALRERIHDADAREREGSAMREWVLRHYILEDHLDDWLLAHLPV